MSALKSHIEHKDERPSPLICLIKDVRAWLRRLPSVRPCGALCKGCPAQGGHYKHAGTLHGACEPSCLACRGVRGRRVSEAGIAEKKISILEQALKFHPGSDELLLALLTAAETVLSPDDMLER